MFYHNFCSLGEEGLSLKENYRHSILMNALFKIDQLFTLTRLRKIIVALCAGLFILLLATGCTPADTSASTQMAPPEATAADVKRAKDNLSDTAVDENKLSRQRPVPNQTSGNRPSVQ